MRALSKISGEVWRWLIGGAITILGIMAVYGWNTARTVENMTLRLQLAEDRLKVLESASTESGRTANLILVEIKGLTTSQASFEKNVEQNLAMLRVDIRELRQEVREHRGAFSGLLEDAGSARLAQKQFTQDVHSEEPFLQ